jgi:hypothetical protein
MHLKVVFVDILHSFKINRPWIAPVVDYVILGIEFNEHENACVVLLRLCEVPLWNKTCLYELDKLEGSDVDKLLRLVCDKVHEHDLVVSRKASLVSENWIAHDIVFIHESRPLRQQARSLVCSLVNCDPLIQLSLKETQTPFVLLDVCEKDLCFEAVVICLRLASFHNKRHKLVWRQT